MLFFFYGTLMAGNSNAVAEALHTKLRPLGAGTARGTLHAIPDPLGWYPALLSGAGTVQGALYESTQGFGEADLAQIDAYEGYEPENPGDSFYLRESLPVTAAVGGLLQAQAYRFNQPLPPGAMPIAGGDFAAWLTASGFQALRDA